MNLPFQKESFSVAAPAFGNTSLDRVLGTLYDVAESVEELMSTEKTVQVQGMKSREIAMRAEKAIDGDENDVQCLCVYLETVAASLLQMERWQDPVHPAEHIHAGKTYSPSETVQEQITSIQTAPPDAFRNITFSFAMPLSHYMLIQVHGRTVTNVEVIGQNGEGRAVVERWKAMNR